MEPIDAGTKAADRGGLHPLHRRSLCEPAYAGEQFKVLGEQQIKHGTLIKTQIIKSNGEPVAINYVVHDNDSAWQIRDIYLSGAISELATHRSEFAQTLRTSGIDGLIGSLNKKADELQS